MYTYYFAFLHFEAKNLVGVAILTFLRCHRGCFWPYCGPIAARPKLKLRSNSTPAAAAATAAAKSKIYNSKNIE